MLIECKDDFHENCIVECELEVLDVQILKCISGLNSAVESSDISMLGFNVSACIVASAVSTN
jgi:hypothetical protein